MTTRRFAHLVVMLLAVVRMAVESCSASSAAPVATVTAKSIDRRRQPQQYVVFGSFWLAVAIVLSVSYGILDDRRNVSLKPGRKTWVDRIHITSMASWLTTRFGTSSR